MARMIPPNSSVDTPAGEAILFRKLRDDPDTEGWVVLHSLELRKHRTKTEGEVDMVILAPGLGIICLEIKGCDVVRRDGLWIYPYGTSVEGPFRQASKAMHSLRDYLHARDSNLSGLLFFSAAAFTRVQFSEDSPEWHPWQVIDSRTLGRMPISRVITRIFEEAHKHVLSRTGGSSWYDKKASRPTPEQVRRIVGLLRGNFEYLVQPRGDVKRIEESLLRLTEEQYGALDVIQDNRRVVLKGLAGTGKTFLAIEAAKRAASEGKRVLLICFNRLLADWMKLAMRDVNEKRGQLLRVAHLHGLLREIAGNSVAIRNDREFWSRELPNRVVDCLLEDDCSVPPFDLLLVDEAQDILVDDYLDVLDLLVAGGLAGGHWAFFGDFDRQAIYLTGGSRTAATMLESLLQRSPHHTNFTLRINCRNAAPIAETLTLACNVRPGYTRFLHEMEGGGVDPLFWNCGEDQEALLNSAASELRRAFHADEIVILSLNADEKSCAGHLADREPGKFLPLRQLGTTGASSICYTSVHAFKGLEAPAIILTDIMRLDEQARALLYVGMSRARVRLILLMHETCRKAYDLMLEAGLGPTVGG